MDIDDKMDDILNAFLVWHWMEFKTGKYEKLGHVPFSIQKQKEAVAAIKQLLKSIQLEEKIHTGSDSWQDGYNSGYNVGLNAWKEELEL